MKKRMCVLMLVVALLMSGCSDQNIQDPSTSKSLMENPEAIARISSENTEVEDVLYSKEYYAFPGGYVTKGVVRLGTSLLLYGSMNGKSILGLAEYNVDTSGEVSIEEAKTICLDEPESVYEAMVYGINAGGDGCFYALTGEFPAEYTIKEKYCTNPDYQGRFSVLKYSDSGSFMCKSELNLPNFSNMQGIIVDESERVILYGGDTVLCIEKDGTIKETQTGENSYILSGSLCDDKVIFQVYSDEGEYLCYYPDSGKIVPFMIHNEDQTIHHMGIDSTSICQGLNEEYITCESSRFFSCNLDEAICSEIFRWNYSMYYKACPYVCRLSEKSFVCSVSGEEYLLVTGLAQRPKTERSIVNVALYDMDESGVGSALRKLNASGSEYEYVERNYNVNELDRLLADIYSDSPPDLLLYNNNVNTTSSAFEDLYTFIDADNELSRESFLPNLLEALSVNGELHELWQDVTVNTLAARTSDVGSGIGLKVEDYERIVASSEKYEAVFQSFMSKENLLKWVATIGISSFIDKENGTCNFDNQDFSQMIAWCASMGNDVPEGSDYSSLDISEVLLSVEMISTPDRLKTIRENFGEPYVFVGFPITENRGNFYSNGYNGCMAIPKASRNKEGAWEFIRSQLIESTQLNVKYSLPVNLSALKHMAESVLTDEELDLFMGLLNDTKYVENYNDSAVRDIIIECGEAYLSGVKTLDETISLIQTKASVYFAEQYG